MNFNEIFEAENIWFSIITVALAVITALILHFAIFWYLKRSRLFTDREFINNVRNYLYAPMRLLFVILFIILVYPSLGFITASYFGLIRHILSLALIADIVWLAIKMIRLGGLLLMRQYDLDVKDNYEARKAYTQFHMIENILIFLITVLGIGIMLMTFDAVREVGVSLLTSAGIAGIILGFAAQKLIATILAGVQIAFTQPFRIDDVVIVEDEWGRIEEINLTYVVVKIWDERRLVVPTTYFLEKPFQNWTRTEAQILGTVYILTDYQVPFIKLREELTRLLESTPLWDKRVNVLQVTDTKENTIELRALMSARDASIAWDLRVFVREKLISYLQNNYPESLPRTRVNIEQMEMTREK